MGTKPELRMRVIHNSIWVRRLMFAIPPLETIWGVVMKKVTELPASECFWHLQHQEKPSV